jgi:hypothetical protein
MINHNESYIEAHNRMSQRLDALVNLLDTMAWTPSTPREREAVTVLFTAYRKACLEVRELGNKTIIAKVVAAKEAADMSTAS